VGTWIESPLFTEKDRFEPLTDIAICKIDGMPDGAAHQPLNMSLNAFTPSEAAYALGYAEMEDMPLIYNDAGVTLGQSPKGVMELKSPQSPLPSGDSRIAPCPQALRLGFGFAA
jgi:hypothetical protein